MVSGLILFCLEGDVDSLVVCFFFFFFFKGSKSLYWPWKKDLAVGVKLRFFHLGCFMFPVYERHVRVRGLEALDIGGKWGICWSHKDLCMRACVVCVCVWAVDLKWKGQFVCPLWSCTLSASALSPLVEQWQVSARDRGACQTLRHCPGAAETDLLQTAPPLHLFTNQHRPAPVCN